MKNIILLFVSAMFLIPALAFAAPYGEAGCGWGSDLMGADGNQILALTTNWSSGTQLFGITTGTSNCVDSERAAVEQQMFITVNYDKLSRDIAVGKGEHLIAFSGLLGCPPANSNQLASVLKRNFNRIYRTEESTPQEVLASIRTTVRSDENLSNSCIASR